MGHRRWAGWLVSSFADREARTGCDSLFEGGLLSIVRTNSPTSVRLGDGLEYISVWATLPNMLTFWDDAPVL